MVRRKQSTVEDLVEVAAVLPWWVGVVLAVVAWAGFNTLATLPVLPLTSARDMGSFAGRQVWKTIGLVLQYLAPLVFLGGAAVSAYRQHKRNKLHDGVVQRPNRNALEDMSWSQFEVLVAETFRRKGFSVEQRGGNGPDGGVDLVLRLGSDAYLVQCKQWKAQQVGVKTVRELFGVMAAERAVGGFVVASGAFTEEARRFAEGRSIELLGTGELLSLISETADKIAAQPPATSDPVCPSCGARMIRRTARRGSAEGSKFWGCSRYPTCKGTRAI
jgi:restriction system protein